MGLGEVGEVAGEVGLLRERGGREWEVSSRRPQVSIGGTAREVREQPFKRSHSTPVGLLFLYLFCQK